MSISADQIDYDLRLSKLMLESADTRRFRPINYAAVAVIRFSNVRSFSDMDVRVNSFPNAYEARLFTEQRPAP